MQTPTTTYRIPGVQTGYVVPAGTGIYAGPTSLPSGISSIFDYPEGEESVMKILRRAISYMVGYGEPSGDNDLDETEDWPYQDESLIRTLVGPLDWVSDLTRKYF